MSNLLKKILPLFVSEILYTTDPKLLVYLKKSWFKYFLFLFKNSNYEIFISAPTASSHL